MASSKPLIQLDGSTLEGGGQLLRNAVALSALTQTPVRIPNVRLNRDPPGLKAQHAAGLALVTAIVQAHAEGIEKGSTCVSFDPTAAANKNGCVRGGEYEADPGTAGSTTLLLQVALPVLMFPQPGTPANEGTVDAEGEGVSMDLERNEGCNSNAEVFSTLTLRGGTNALHAPQADYAQHVLIPFLTTHILPPSSPPLKLDIKQRGFYPHGGGLLRVLIPPLHRGQHLRPVTLTERGRVVSVKGTIIVSGVIGRRVAQEMKDAALLELIALSPELQSLNPSFSAIRVDVESNPLGRAGSAIFLRATTSTGCVLAGSALGSKGVRAATTGQEAARELVRNLDEGGCVDCWMQDQMIIFLALAKGRSVIRTGKITLHTRTAIWVAERLIDAKFEVKENVDGTGQSLIVCEGIGLEGRL